MSPGPGFRVDLANCVGCKACQVACKDENGLAPGILWRRVVEVTGGEWVRRGGCDLDETFAYFVSLACMHCERPICAEVCPTKAVAKGPDGVVAIDTDRCMGCRYCEWACPYLAPQFDPVRGVMTKCDFCQRRRAEGRDPACVVACPLRVLTVGEFAGPGTEGVETFPLPAANLTEPRTALLPHRDVSRAGAGRPRVANREEI